MVRDEKSAKYVPTARCAERLKTTLLSGEICYVCKKKRANLLRSLAALRIAIATQFAEAFGRDPSYVVTCLAMIFMFW